MRLTMLSDYALRVLLYAAANPGRLVTIDETLQAFPVSRGHIMKVVLTLGQAGILQSRRGRSGGFTLAARPDKIRLGDVLRLTEPDYQMVECLGPQSSCPITRTCKLPAVVQAALAAFMAVMDHHTLADVLLQPADFLPHPGTDRRQNA
ncbi:MAG: Rrf2 family transcriptional regulator [Paracoccaceae bacterium]|nr:Rrf2 family transcriptional regulator [Paracoccaceae bacterium]